MFALMTTVPPSPEPRDDSDDRRERHLPQANPHHRRHSTDAGNARTFMDIFACKKCKRSKRNRDQQQQFADNEGYSSADDEYRLTQVPSPESRSPDPLVPPESSHSGSNRSVKKQRGRKDSSGSNSVSSKRQQQQQQQQQQQNNGSGSNAKNSSNNNNSTTPSIPTSPSAGSLRRPLTCKLPFVKRTPSKKGESRGAAGASAGGGTGSLGAPSSNFVETWRSLPNLRSPSLAVRAMTITFKALTTHSKDDPLGNHHKVAKAKKKARFNEDVDVILHDDDGKPLYTQSVKIKFDDDASGSNGLYPASGTSGVSSSGRKGRKKGGKSGGKNKDGGGIFMSRNKMAAAGDGQHMDGHEAAMMPAAPRLHHARSPTPELIRMDYMDIKRQPDGQKFLKCVIFISKEFDRRNITVRTAMGGSRLVLIAQKHEPLGDGTLYLKQFVEKFRLPHAIDPNQVNAVMHSAGDLVIEAPLFEFETDN